jgi:GTP diphosphokinase / guanosine-3',5'-bis(diphosphate) 3'-diphosphatase
MDLYSDIENKYIRSLYRSLLKACRPLINQEDKKVIRKAFNLALEAHKGQRRKSGELYIMHPISVAIICAKEIGLGATSVICALLHDVVEDTEVTLEEIEAIFGVKVARIIDGLTKIGGIIGGDATQSIQAENFRKILLTMGEDVRVIIIKIADRLHNMRTLDVLLKQKQLKIASETIELFAPLAHRLGLYSIKNELEDLCFKYIEPAVYQVLDSKLKANREQINKFTRIFIKPIQESLESENFKYEIRSRLKSLYSIYKKMKYKNVSFEEVYDLFAIRIIIDDSKNEKADCWRVFSIVTDFYKPNSDRLRDWLSTPKVNGYESLHTTVMGPTGRWVEVQIRSRRMDDIAEKGYAAHWKYKGNDPTEEGGIDEWLKKISELLQHTDESAIEFFDEFKLNLFARELFVFTPKGELLKLPINSTALDFAFEIHSNIGLKCIGAKVNNKLVPFSYVLKNGDQVEVISAQTAKVQPEWLDFVVTAKARSSIKRALKDEKRKSINEGKQILSSKFGLLNLKNWTKELTILINYFQLPSEFELYYNIGIGKIDAAALANVIQVHKIGIEKATDKKDESQVILKQEDSNVLVIGENLDMNYSIASCCNPIPGDEIFGFVTIGDGIIIHRTNCPVGIRLMANYGYRIIEARWSQPEIQDIDPYQVGVRFTGIDRLGIIGELTSIIANKLRINIRSLNVNTVDGALEGHIIADVFDTKHLETLIDRMKNIEGIEAVTRFHVEEMIKKE